MRLGKCYIPILFTVIITAFIWLAVSESSPTRLSGTQPDPVLWETGWQVETADGSLRAIQFPARLEEGETVIVNTLPEKLHPSTIDLYIKTNYQQVGVTVDAQPVAVNGISAVSGGSVTFDLPWSSAVLTDDMASMPIRISFSDTGSKPVVELYSMRLGIPAKVNLALLTRSLPTIVLSLLVILLSLALFSFALLEAHRNQKRISAGYYYLILFALLAGVWFYTDTDISGVSYIGVRAFFYVNLFSYLLMPLPFFLFIRYRQPALKRICYLLDALLAANVLFQILLILTGKFLLWIALLYTHMLITFSCALLFALLSCGSNPLRKQQELSWGTLITALAGLLTLILFYIFPIEDNSSAFRYGVLILVMSLVISVLRANVDILVEANRFEALRIREEEYRIAVKQSEKTVLRYNVSTESLISGDESSPLFAPDEELANVPQSMIEDNRVADESIADIRQFFQSIQSGNPAGSCVANLRNRDGSYTWYHIDYTLIFNDSSEPSQAVISLYDVSELRQKEMAYRKWKQQYANMNPEGMKYYEYNLTRNQLIEEAGLMLPPLPGNKRHTLAQATTYLADRFVTPNDAHRFHAFFDRDRMLNAYESHVFSDKLEFLRLDPDGQVRWTLATIQLIADPYTHDVQTFLLFQDEDATKRSELQARARSISDPLTGLLNRAAFEEQLNQLLRQSGADTAHALLMIDLDNFKTINDSFGHQFGDRALTDIANSLRATLRGDDLIGRIGGDEYMICIQNIDSQMDYVNRRASFICQAMVKHYHNDIDVTGSIGIALFPKDGRDFATLYQKADMALYHAKHHGKNRFVFFNDGLAKGGALTPQSLYGDDTAWVPLSAHGTQSRTLLIAEPDEDARVQLKDIFQRDYQLMMAESSAQCLKMLDEEHFAVSAVVLDISNAAQDDAAMLERILRRADAETLPVLITTQDVESGMRAVEAGATDFFSKPFNPQLVRLRMKNAIHRQETEELRSQNRYLLMQKNDELRHQNELRYIAEHDSLTSICNKAAFYRKTKAMLDMSPNTTFVMIAFDIEKFRLINDIFGHTEGDRLLRYVAQRMQTAFGTHSTYGRIVADNFALCIPYRREDLEDLRISTDLDLKEYDLSFEITLVFGLYIIDDRTLPVSIMHDRAEMAKRTVKGNYVKRYAYYNDTLRKALLDEQQIINDMNEALQSKQFEVYLQPKCVLSTGEIIGAEALVRWNHPTRGLLMPGAFVPLFEKNGFIMKMDAYVWESVFALMRKWMDRHDGKPPIPLSMNVSRVDMYNPSLVTILCDLADRYQVPRKYIELEITESAYADDPKQLSELIAVFQREGFTVEMDDFGSAYSSLNMLKELPVDMLKLDMRFLSGSDLEGRGGTILNSIVRMARYLNLPIVAEGVETAEQVRFLLSIGCSQGQGYYYYKPMPVAEFEELFNTCTVKTLVETKVIYPESVAQRVWSIDGDFSMMLATIPCAASVCELNGDTIELLRVNQQYLEITGDHVERVYQQGTDVRNLTTSEEYPHLLRLFQTALETQGIAEGVYRRSNENGSIVKYRLNVKYLIGNETRSLYFLTYWPLCCERESNDI